MKPVEVNYMIVNRDPTKTADLVVKISEPPTNSKSELSGSEWIIAGSKLINSILVLPRTSQVVSLVGIPTRLGQINGPKVEVFQRINHRSLMMSMDASNRLSSEQYHQPSLCSLKDLQDLDSSYDGSDPGSQSNTKLVPIEIFRTDSLVEKLGTGIDPNLVDDPLKSQNRPTKNPDQHLKVFVLPA
jgi:hypothetical protein